MARFVNDLHPLESFVDSGLVLVRMQASIARSAFEPSEDGALVIAIRQNNKPFIRAPLTPQY